MPKMGLVLQGGGALGAYEYGAVTGLVELGWHPVAVTGVSIGAATAAAIAGAPDGDICKSLKRLWEAITLDPVPFWPPERQTTFSIFGNPRFWRTRHDVFSYLDWTSLYDVSPMRETLAKVCDFNQLNDPTHMRVAVTATNVQTGDQVCFANFVGNPDSVYYVTPRISRVSLTPDHILASGSLPPGFPMTMIDGVPYWDGGLFDNTPNESMLDLLTEEELENLPIFIVNLFGRFLLEHADADGSLMEFVRTVEEIMRDLPAESPVRQRESFRRLVRFRALKNIKVIEADHAPMTGGMDFSAHGVHTRYKSGYAAVDKLLTGIATT